ARPSPTATLFPYTTLFRSRAPLINGLYIYPIDGDVAGKKTRHTLPSGLVFNSPVYASGKIGLGIKAYDRHNGAENMNGIYQINVDRKSTRLNSSHVKISYA